MRNALAVLALCSALSAQAQHRVDNRSLLGIVAVEQTNGVAVAHVLEGSPADEAGIAVEDLLLTIAGHKIARATDVDVALREADPGDEVRVQLRRRGKGKTLHAKVVERKAGLKSFVRRRGEAGFAAPAWWAFGWANTSRKRPAPTLENTRGKVVVFHAFQSW